MIAAPLRLARFLTAKGWSQSELARQLPGVSRSHVCHWFARRRTPTLAQAVAIERVTRGWDEGPIRPAEWVPVQPKVAAA